MKKINLIVLFALINFLPGMVCSQTPKQDPGTGKWGVEENGNWIISPDYEEIGPMLKDGNNNNKFVFPVKQKGLWGFINNSNKWVTKPAFEYIGTPDEYIQTIDGQEINTVAILVEKDGNWGYVGAEGKELIKTKYPYLSPIYNDIINNEKVGLTVAIDNNKASVLDMSGKSLLTRKYHNFMFIGKDIYGKPDIYNKWVKINKLNNEPVSLVTVTENGNYWTLSIKDENGIIYLPETLEYYTIIKDNIVKDKNGKYGIFKDGQLVIPALYNEITPLGSYYIVKNDNNRTGLITNDNHQVLDFNYSDIKNFESNPELFLIQNNNLKGIFDANSNKIIVPVEWEDIEDLGNGIVSVFLNNKGGLYSLEKSKLILPVEYDDFGVDETAQMVIYKDDLSGIFDYKLESVIIQPIYKDIFQLDNYNYIVIDSSDNSGLYNTKDNQFILEPKYSYIESTDNSDDFLIVSLGDKYGVYSFSTKQYILPCIFDKIIETEKFPDFKVELGDHKGYYDGKLQKFLVDPKVYKDYHFRNNKKIAVNKNGLWGLIDYSGKTIIPFQYSGIDDSSAKKDTYYLISKNGHNGLANKNGTVLFSPGSMDTWWYKPGYVVVQKGKKLGLILESGKIVTSPKYDVLGFMGKGNFVFLNKLVNGGNELTVISKDGKILDSRKVYGSSKYSDAKWLEKYVGNFPAEILIEAK